MNPAMMAAFADELEKLAVSPVGAVGEALHGAAQWGMRQAAGARGWAGKTIERSAERLRHPISGMTEGWGHLAPRAEFAADPAKLKKLQEATEGYSKKWFGGARKKLFGSEHLMQHVEKPQAFMGREGILYGQGAKGVGGRIKATAEELSRRGWTGEGGATKYLPVGQKGLTAGLPLTAIPGIVNAPKTNETGEGGALERTLGEVGSAGGFILSGGLGWVPGVGMTMAGGHLGSKMGRVLDRLRAGASLGTAVNAPSPTEAARQAATIQRYYGQP